MPLQMADVIMPGCDNAFEVGHRTAIASIGELPPVHRALLEKPVTATLATLTAQARRT